MKRFALGFSALLLCCSLMGCTASKEDNQEKSSNQEVPKVPEDGGTTDLTDENASKEIQSQEISTFQASFYTYDRYEPDEKSGMYDISVTKAEDGTCLVKVQGVHNHEVTADGALMAELQSIIDQNNLVSRNGIYRVTAGLAPEYGPWSLNVAYTSGETLSFTEDGYPYSPWTKALRDLVIQLMAEAGYEDVLPAKEAVTITSFSFEYREEGINQVYAVINRNGEQTLRYSPYRDDQTEDFQRDHAAVSGELFEGLQKVIESTGLDTWEQPVTYINDEKLPDDASFAYQVEYESGRFISGQYNGSQLPGNWPAIWSELSGYLQQYLENHLLNS